MCAAKVVEGRQVLRAARSATLRTTTVSYCISFLYFMGTVNVVLVLDPAPN